MATDRILVENCAVISTTQIRGVELPLSQFPFKQTTVTFTESCPNCGASAQLKFGALRTRQGKRFLCPKCGRGVQNLYRPPQAAMGDWACKNCHGLVYSSQYRKKTGSRNLGTFGLLGLGGHQS